MPFKKQKETKIEIKKLVDAERQREGDRERIRQIKIKGERGAYLINQVKVPPPKKIKK